jgi:hypothetical protein
MAWEKWVEDGDEKQSTRFGWPEVLVDKLAPATAGFTYDREAVKQFLTVTFQSQVKYKCDQLGLTAAPPREVGERIEADPELVAKLAPYLGIKNWRVFDAYNPNQFDTAVATDPDKEV